MILNNAQQEFRKSMNYPRTVGFRKDVGFE